MEGALAEKLLYLEDAQNVFTFADDDPSESLNAARVQDAGLFLSAEVRRLEREEVERLRAQLRGVSLQHAEVGGGAITPGHDSGGDRHFLADADRPAGEGLYLLTELAWMPGRYESRYPDGVVYLSGSHDHDRCPRAVEDDPDKGVV